MARPSKAQDITDFAIELGYGSKDEFIAAQPEGSIGGKKGSEWVFAEKDYVEAPVQVDGEKTGVETGDENESLWKTFSGTVGDIGNYIKNKVSDAAQLGGAILNPADEDQKAAQSKLIDKVFPGPIGLTAKLLKGDNAGAATVKKEDESKFNEPAVQEVEPVEKFGKTESVGKQGTDESAYTIVQAKIDFPESSAAIEALYKLKGTLEAREDEDVELTRSDIESVDREITDYNTRVSDIASEKAKPFFGEEDTGRMFLAAIAAGMGAYAAAMTGTRNFALDTINQAIDRDLKAQKSNKEFRLRDIEGQRTLLLSRKAELQQYALTQMEINRGYAKDSQRMEETIIAMEAELAKTAQGHANAVAIQEAKFGFQRDAELRKKTSKNKELFIPGFGQAKSLPAWKESSTFYTGYIGIMPKIERARYLIKNHNVKVLIPGSDERIEVHSLLSSVRLDFKNNIAKLGAATTETEIQNFLNDIVPELKGGATFTELTLNTVEDKLRVLVEDLDGRLKAHQQIYTVGGTGTAPTEKKEENIKGMKAGL